MPDSRVHGKAEPTPKLDWEPGDPADRWPHGFVQWSEMAEGICGVVINNTNGQRCCGAPEWAIHNVGARESQKSTVKTPTLPVEAGRSYATSLETRS